MRKSTRVAVKKVAAKKQVARTKSKRSRVKPIDFAKTPTLSTFSLRTKLVKHGSRNDHLAETKNLSMQVRVYSPHEGPNGLHCSPYMDHSFVVLEGTARFHGPRGEVWDIGRHEGVMIPAGAFYCFENFGDDVLVIMRAASFDRRRGNPDIRFSPKGEHFTSTSPKNLRPVDHTDSDQYFE